ncbi:hypothetical protein E2C01_042324 [Portunus trituberculatus]|uniref:Uncharacterized protein n=1 Tax=Portunus trituberculatus TaxID=210409 RepID=A0A5B7FTD5_PORTR|nr:hypothetical protein [Portunus trituberculatus]
MECSNKEVKEWWEETIGRSGGTLQETRASGGCLTPPRSSFLNLPELGQGSPKTLPCPLSSFA